MIRQQDIKAQRVAQKVQEKAKLKVAYDKLKRESDSTIKSMSDEISAKDSYINELEQELALRKEQDSIIVCENGKYIVNLVHTLAYNERIPLQVVSGINLSTITKTPLYAKIPFLYKDGNTIKIDKEQYNKYKIVGGL